MNPATSDPGDLSHLHDIVLPPSPAWWPPAVGWFVLAGILLLLLLLSAWKIAVWWWRSRYRRAALAEFEQLAAHADQPETLRALAELVKRTALAVYPRERVAGLSGGAWLRFLDASVPTKDFTQGAGRQLEAGYERGEQIPRRELFVAVKDWIQHHRMDFIC